MSAATDTVREQLAQLDTVRNVVLSDAALYPRMVEAVLPIIGANAHLRVRRWGVEFLAETFASPVLDQDAKQSLSPIVLGLLQDLISNPAEDSLVVKFVVQTAASIYPLIYRNVAEHPEQKEHWEEMTAIKQQILTRWNSAPTDVRICCIRFAQKVVYVQTMGAIDPRRPDRNEISLNIVPRTHPVLQLPSLQAEASGLLDRLLNLFYENSSDSYLVNATLNGFAGLMRNRQSVANKVLDALICYNPIAAAMKAGAPLTPAVKVSVTSIERTVRALLLYFIKRNPGHPLNTKLHHAIERLAMSKIEMLQEAPRKRQAPTEPTDLVDSAKRARLGVETPPQLFKIPPLPAGPISVAQLFTLTEDQELCKFDVTQLPVDMLVTITTLLLAKAGKQAMDHAIQAIQTRHEEVSKRAAYNATQSQQAVEEDDDDYEPEYDPDALTIEPAGATTAAETDGGASGAPATESASIAPDLALGPFVIPQPKPFSAPQATELAKDTASRLLRMVTKMEQSSQALVPAQSAAAGLVTSQHSHTSAGFNRLAASAGDRSSWSTLLTRIATRSTFGLETSDSTKTTTAITSSIRESLYRFILEDFRGRLGLAISWLCEEWYAEMVSQKATRTTDENTPTNGHSEQQDNAEQPKFYEQWALRMFEGFLPYLDAKDLKVLVRFLSELPGLFDGLLERVRSLANDPERVSLCVRAFHPSKLFMQMCPRAVPSLIRSSKSGDRMRSRQTGPPPPRSQRNLLQKLEAEPSLAPLANQHVDRSIRTMSFHRMSAVGHELNVCPISLAANTAALPTDWVAWDPAFSARRLYARLAAASCRTH
ncbi:hypothetical protein KEM52_003999 [Ascosphaera acerosa]|nr:hypothetical protein KEM52_003999 [Ascosphaera acerosa]